MFDGVFVGGRISGVMAVEAMATFLQNMWYRNELNDSCTCCQSLGDTLAYSCSLKYFSVILHPFLIEYTLETVSHPKRVCIGRIHLTITHGKLFFMHAMS